jgi:hypothetical protein
VGKRHWFESGNFGDPSELPTEQQVTELFENVTKKLGQQLGIQVEAYYSFAYQSKRGFWSPVPPESDDDVHWDQTWRMPDIGMINQALFMHKLRKEDVLMVSAFDYAKEAAEKAEIQFAKANDFFGLRGPQYPIAATQPPAPPAHSQQLLLVICLCQQSQSLHTSTEGEEDS